VLVEGPPGQAERIHRALERSDVGAEVFAVLDRALDEGPARVAALDECARWFGSYVGDGFATPERVDRIVELALRSPDEHVRAAAAGAARKLSSRVWPAVRSALDDDDPAVLVRAGELAVAVEPAQSPPADVEERLIDLVRAVVRDPAAADSRRRAGAVLGGLPDGLEPFHRPIVAALDRADPRPALELTETTVAFLSDDVDLWWWRGHALYDLDRPAEATASYEKAFALDPSLSNVAQEAANALMSAGEPELAVEWARRAVTVNPQDPGAHGVLAWARYQAGADAEALAAAHEALDRDPIHPSARWLTALVHLRRGEEAAMRTAVADARRVDALLLRTPDAWLAAQLEGVCHIDTSP
jgi:tetratricopeptide (TPR) repeat protein